MKCFLCGCSLEERGVQPKHVFDLEKGVLLGTAHAMCVREHKIDDDCIRSSARDPMPSEAQIKFAAKLYKMRRKMRRQAINGARQLDTESLQFSVYILGHFCIYETANIEEVFEHPKVQDLLHHWEHGVKTKSSSQIEEIKEILREELES